MSILTVSHIKCFSAYKQYLDHNYIWIYTFSHYLQSWFLTKPRKTPSTLKLQI